MKTKQRSSELEQERHGLLRQIEDGLETPMLVLGVVCLALVVLELTVGLSPFLERVGAFIWGVFLVDFAVRLTVAPSRWAYLKSNWLTALSLAVTALRVTRFARLLRAARAVRGVRLLKVVSTLNRGMRTLGTTLGRQGYGDVTALTALVTLLGAAGMRAFEGTHLATYGEALWWTAMLMTTMGSEFWPKTAEGRLLCVLLALYAFAVFGYVTATIATFFLGKGEEGEAATAVREEIAALREEVRRLMEQRAG